MTPHSRNRLSRGCWKRRLTHPADDARRSEAVAVPAAGWAGHFISGFEDIAMAPALYLRQSGTASRQTLGRRRLLRPLNREGRLVAADAGAKSRPADNAKGYPLPSRGRAMTPAFSPGITGLSCRRGRR